MSETRHAKMYLRDFPPGKILTSLLSYRNGLQHWISWVGIMLSRLETKHCADAQADLRLCCSQKTLNRFSHGEGSGKHVHTPVSPEASCLHNLWSTFKTHLVITDFEHPKRMYILMGKTIVTNFYAKKICLSLPKHMWWEPLTSCAGPYDVGTIRTVSYEWDASNKKDIEKKEK